LAVLVGAVGIEVVVGGTLGPETVSVKSCVATGLTALSAVTVIGYVPELPADPVIEAVPSPLFKNVIPAGKAPDSLRSALGVPVEVIVYVPEDPAAKVVLGALVILGDCRIPQVHVCAR
jgi:hypothetical protein